MKCSYVPCVDSIYAVAPVPAGALSGSALQCKNFFLHGWWKVHKHKLTLVIEVILAAFINDPDQVVFGRSWIGENPIDLAGDQGGLVAGVVDTKCEGLRECFHD